MTSLRGPGERNFNAVSHKPSWGGLLIVTFRDKIGIVTLKLLKSKVTAVVPFRGLIKVLN